MRVVAILASHNRRELTLRCLASYYSQRTAEGVELGAVLVDDGSEDGTSAAARERYPDTKVVNGDGNLFWAGAMALGEHVALRGKPDYLLWLNDDVVLDPGALTNLIETSASRPEASIAVGALRDPGSGELTYSGVNRRGLHPLRMERVEPAGVPVEVDTFNGNLVLVPHSMALRVGPIDGALVHSAGDFDYGLRARQEGVTALLAGRTLGTCARDGDREPWLDRSLAHRRRLQLLLGPKGFPPRQRARYLVRHGGPAWFVFWLSPYVRVTGAIVHRALSQRLLRSNGHARSGEAKHRGSKAKRSPTLTSRGGRVDIAHHSVVGTTVRRARAGARWGAPAPILVGPASPRALADLMTGRDRDQAEAIPGLGGVPVNELARALVDCGIDVEVATTATEVDDPMTLEGKRLRLHVAPMRARARHRALDAFRQERDGLLRAIGSSEANVVHAHWTYEFAWAGIDSGRPIVVTAHDAPLTILRHYRDRYRAIRTAMAYRVRLSIPNLTAVSPYLARRWRREMAYRKPIPVIPNIAPALPSPRSRPLEERASRILDVADSGRRKNIPSLVRAFRLLRETHPEAELEVVGWGLASGDELPTALAREGPCRGIRFSGAINREALADTLGTARVFVHPSREECCSMAVLEAMLAGVPVVAGRKAGGTPWVLDQGRAGLLVNIRDPRDIARGVATLLEDDMVASGYAERARRRADECFSPRVVSSAYLDEYERVLAGSS